MTQSSQPDNPYIVISIEDVNRDHCEYMAEIGQLKDYYAFATFMPPGENKIVVTFDDLFDQNQYFLNKSIVPIRKTEIPLHKKRIKKQLIMRQFNKAGSVFSEWREDSPGLLKRAFQIDMTHSKIQKLVRDDYQEVYELLFSHLPRLKEIFTY